MRRNGSVLVIDDEEIMREILQALLEREGYAVRLAASGQEGLELARALPFDAVIVDVMMPGIDGMEARMRVSSVMLPASSCGTLRSARMKTFLPATSRSASFFTCMLKLQ